MSWKDDLCDAWLENMPENYDQMTKDEQIKAYMKFEREWIENGVAQAEAREDR
jgi:hypothetical protein